MTRILIIGQSYGRGHAATSDLFTDLAEGLAEQGLLVEVLTSAADGELASMAQSSSVMINQVSRRGSNQIRKIPVLGRLLNLVSLWLALVSWCIFTPRRYSHVIVLDTPHLLTIAALILQARHRSVAIAWVMDRPLLQIQRLNAPGSIKSRLGGWLDYLQVALFKCCDVVVPLGECMATILQQQGVLSSRISIIRTWDHDDLPSQAIPAAKARKLANLPQHFTVMYSGYAGAWHDFKPVLDCVKTLAYDQNLQFLFVGEGPGIQSVQQWCAGHPDAHVIFRSYVSAQQRNQSLCCGDLHLVCLKASMLGTCVPSKLNALLGLGRPVLVVAPFPCQAALDVEESGSGLCTPSSNMLINAVKKMAQDNFTATSLSRNAVHAYLYHHCRKVNIEKWAAIVLKSSDQASTSSNS